MKKSKLILISLISLRVIAQHDNTDDITSKRDTIEFIKSMDLSEIILTSDKKYKKVTHSTVPVTLISRGQLKNAGDGQLINILGSTMGINIDSSDGDTPKLQLQGLDQEYTLMLVNGVQILSKNVDDYPDLNEIVDIDNIKQIEIIKGSASSEYGSQAVAGVINIITKPILENKLSGSFRYTKFNDLGGSLHTQYCSDNKWNISTDIGFSKNLPYFPYINSEQNSVKKKDLYSKFRFASVFSSQNTPDLKTYTSSRLNFKRKSYYSEVSNQNSYSDLLNFNLAPTITYDVSERLSTKLSIFSSIHSYKQTKKGKLAEYSQGSLEGEYILEHKLSNGDKMVYGIGNNFEEVLKLDNRTIDPIPEREYEYMHAYARKHNVKFYAGRVSPRLVSHKKKDYKDPVYFYDFYSYGQYSAKFFEKLEVVLGLRFNFSLNSGTGVGVNLDPKASFKYDITDYIDIKVSVAKGIRTPNLKHYYVLSEDDSSNILLGSERLGQEAFSKYLDYRVSEEVRDYFNKYNVPVVGLGDTEIDYKYWKIYASILIPESSIGTNIELTYKPIDAIDLKLELFRNDIENMIEKANLFRFHIGSYVKTYVNIGSVFTQGIALSSNYEINDNISLSIGCQYLEAKDKVVLEDIRAGKIFSKKSKSDKNKIVVKESDYGGLENRPKYSGNIKLFLNDILEGISTNISFQYKGRMGVNSHFNHNEIIDSEEEYSKPTYVVDMGLTKRFLEDRLKFILEIDNVFNQTPSTEYYTLKSSRPRSYNITLRYEIL
ncbi:TonB-dependent receptor plug domain-containing protein [Ichthyobacterium seriolicida]|uniref:TonB-dependent receptor n=1 Tax=Ichthyobacterium seriolicida TaxID=242600 RepID=A0A1J1EAK6_9FLAO|nr:TonB-dependent receptor [Ichthyobacterium seriolicida]BAV94971.1 TonB-dependent receptor [Ichthyobacterium seriolicida]